MFSSDETKLQSQVDLKISVFQYFNTSSSIKVKFQN